MKDIERLTDHRYQIFPVGQKTEQTSFTINDHLKTFSLSGKDHQTNVNIKDEIFTGKQIRQLLWLKNNYRAIAQGIPSILINDLLDELHQKFSDL